MDKPFWKANSQSEDCKSSMGDDDKAVSEEGDLDDDIAFFRVGDKYDEELDNEIREENLMLRKEHTKFDKLSKKKPGTYARYGKEFQERKLTGYVESESDNEVGDSILSDKEADCDLKSIASSSDEEDYMLGDIDWCVRKVNRRHNDCPNMKITLCNSTFLAKVLEGKIRLLLDITQAVLMVIVHKLFKLTIGKNCARRLKEKALKKINGDDVEQSNLAITYCKELMKTHPGSTCYVNYVDPSIHTEPCVFRRLYICLKPLVKGLYAGCKKVIGLDGCHTKGLYKQQILTAVGLDNNNGCWPIAWAVVEKENADTWEWFLEGLIQDIGIVNQEEYVVISDKQKGLEQLVGLKKNRKKDISEIKKKGRNEKLRKWVIAHCGWCGETGHNKRSCQSRKSGKEPVKPASKKKKQQTELQPPSTEKIEQQPPSTENELEQQPPTIENELEPPINASRRRSRQHQL
ncbi:hypothetical protein LIER_15235 [Lithospermum erythrorhizon]|uniref:MULE transposase domain-containing protein n=1 Tax=Lithospermum erythrorhizon TaxID=34254 RepID=A0AAV3Q3P3_LITER